MTFFLQSPHFLSDLKYYDEILKLVGDSADLYPDIDFLVREHPEYRMEKQELRKLDTYSNVRIVSNWDLKEVFNLTLVVVSHFSSVLMEGVVHGCIPLVYDPTTCSRYCPDVEKEGLGRIAKTEEDFQLCLKEILEEQEECSGERLCSYLRRMEEQRQQWFAATDGKTIERMVNFIRYKS